MNKVISESDTTETEMSGSDAGMSELRFRGVNFLFPTSLYRNDLRYRLENWQKGKEPRKKRR